MFLISRIVLLSLLSLFLVAGSGCRRSDTSDQPTTRVLFDQGHGQHFLIEGEGPLDLSALAALFETQEYTVTSSDQRLSDEILVGQEVLIISGAFEPLMDREIKAVLRFIDQGGRLGVMLHIGEPVAGVLRGLGVAIANGVIREQENLLKEEPLDFRIATFAPHPVTAGLQHVDIYGAWALLNTSTNAAIIARTGPTAWIDLNKDGRLMERDAMQSFGVIVAGEHGRGHFVVFGDDAVFQNQFLENGNEALARNLVAWLKQR